MDVIVATESAGSETISAMLRHLERRSAVCAKVLNNRGELVAINRRGLDLLKVEMHDVCNKVWAAFWSGDARVAAEDSVDRAFRGKTGRFLGEFHGVDGLSFWEVETFPLERDADGHVTSILVISVNITAALDGEAADKSLGAVKALSEALHTVSNLSAVTAASARMLRRCGPDPKVQEIAEALDTAACDANRAVDHLRHLTQKMN